MKTFARTMGKEKLGTPMPSLSEQAASTCTTNSKSARSLHKFNMYKMFFRSR